MRHVLFEKSTLKRHQKSEKLESIFCDPRGSQFCTACDFKSKNCPQRNRKLSGMVLAVNIDAFCSKDTP